MDIIIIILLLLFILFLLFILLFTSNEVKKHPTPIPKLDVVSDPKIRCDFFFKQNIFNNCKYLL